ncbi:MAG TPA: UDP-N-acetylmuramoylalanyl-D-glutamyl-2, 6-diaminopimelate--D-alanyl-D-alanine ligase, partial [Beijerinckiaceae bacterium]|nr:UDP-N-acetylmuramoylalanyl-D-glutamyl-2, 6-diaminopimelate--D-alanyl-D-alanine ligase [Beijerinckiaceae bacterium]
LAVLASLRPEPGGRRIAILGDMLELGAAGAELHAGLAAAVVDSGTDCVFAAGPLMKNLVDALPKARVGGYAADSTALEPLVLAAVRAGDVVTVKGSNGSRMARIVAALKARYPAMAGPGAEAK